MFIESINVWLAEHKSSTLPAWLKRNPTVLHWVMDQTKQFSTKNIMERVYIVLHGSPDICQYGNQRQFNTFDKGYRVGCILGNKCQCIASARLQNQKVTLLKKYGVDTTGKIPGSLDKRKSTMMKKYGVEFAMQIPSVVEHKKTLDATRSDQDWGIISQTRRDTYMKTYGAEHHMKLKSQQQKVKNTNLQKYQSEFPMQNSQVAKKASDTWKLKSLEQRQTTNIKTKNTMVDRYGVDAASRIGMSQETLAVLSDGDAFRREIIGLTRLQARLKLNIAEHTLYLYAKKYNAVDLFVTPNVSAFELEVRQFIESLGIVPLYNNRSILNPQELDIFIPEKNLAIECCGLYWHSENSAGRARSYHSNKYHKCRDADLTLITIFDDEWNHTQDLVKLRLTHLLGYSTSVIYARQCEVMEITSIQASEFISKYHLQGATNSKINLALTHRGDIVAVMTLCKPRYNKTHEYEILRFCTMGSVIGAASKLFKYFKKLYTPTSVLSYSDNRWGSGKVYEAMGFAKSTSTIGYFYTDYKHRYDRIKFQKHRLVAEGADPMLSEWEIMQGRGYDRVWDCGQTLWSYHNT